MTLKPSSASAMEMTREQAEDGLDDITQLEVDMLKLCGQNEEEQNRRKSKKVA